MGVRSKFFDPRSVKPVARTKRGGDFWHKLLPTGYVVLGVSVVVAGLVPFQKQFARRNAEQNRKVELLRQIDREKGKSIRLEEEINALQNDDYYVERKVRDILKYGREGETIFKFSDDLFDSENPVAGARR